MTDDEQLAQAVREARVEVWLEMGRFYMVGLATAPSHGEKPALAQGALQHLETLASLAHTRAALQRVGCRCSATYEKSECPMHAELRRVEEEIAALLRAARARP